jgi:hypothetical protein
MNISEQNFLSLREAAKLFPGQPHISTIFRWTERGIRGNRLETWLIGGKRFTTNDAINSFVVKINGKVNVPSKGREKRILQAEEELKEFGL